MSWVWLGAATLAHTEVRCRKVKILTPSRKNITPWRLALATPSSNIPFERCVRKAKRELNSAMRTWNHVTYKRLYRTAKVQRMTDRRRSMLLSEHVGQQLVPAKDRASTTANKDQTNGKAKSYMPRVYMPSVASRTYSRRPPLPRVSLSSSSRPRRSCR